MFFTGAVDTSQARDRRIDLLRSFKTLLLVAESHTSQIEVVSIEDDDCALNSELHVEYDPPAEETDLALILGLTVQE